MSVRRKPAPTALTVDHAEVWATPRIHRINQRSAGKRPQAGVPTLPEAGEHAVSGFYGEMALC